MKLGIIVYGNCVPYLKNTRHVFSEQKNQTCRYSS